MSSRWGRVLGYTQEGAAGGQHPAEVVNGFIYPSIVTCERLIRKRDGRIAPRWRILR